MVSFFPLMIELDPVSLLACLFIAWHVVLSMPSDKWKQIICEINLTKTSIAPYIWYSTFSMCIFRSWFNKQADIFNHLISWQWSSHVPCLAKMMYPRSWHISIFNRLRWVEKRFTAWFQLWLYISDVYLHFSGGVCHCPWTGAWVQVQSDSQLLEWANPEDKEM